MGMMLSDRRSNLAGAVVDNVLTGKLGRVLNFPAKVSVGATSSVDSLFVTAFIGTEVMIDGQEVNDTAAAVRNPEDVEAQGFGEKGDEIIVKLRNGNAGANVSRIKVFIEPI